VGFPEGVPKVSNHIGLKDDKIIYLIGLQLPFYFTVSRRLGELMNLL
jgi:hypothetical protein